LFVGVNYFIWVGGGIGFVSLNGVSSADCSCVISSCRRQSGCY